METTLHTVESRVLGEKITFVRTAEETNGELLEMEACYAASQDWEHMLMHWHPEQDESFEVLEGIITVEVEGVKRTYVAGERFDVPRETLHGMRNLGSVPVRLRWQVRPAMQTQEFFETIFPLADSGELMQHTDLLITYGRVFRLDAPPSKA